MEYSIQTKKYEGPMELLLDLIHRNRIDISDISIVDITEQYVDYVENIDEVDLDLASDFIDMASKLLEIKSRYILYLKYNKEEEDDPRKELVQKIEEYQKFKEITDTLKKNIKEYEDRYYREREEFLKEDEVDLSDITIEKIHRLMQNIFKSIDERKEAEEILEKNEKLRTIVKSKNIRIESRIELIKKSLSKGVRVKFSELIDSDEKKEVIANFLAILELIKMKDIIIKQSGAYEEIYIEKKNSDEELVLYYKEEEEYEQIAKRAERKYISNKKVK